MVCGLVEPLFTPRREQRRDGGVTAGPLGFREGAVRDLADELRLEVEVVVRDGEEVAFGEVVEQLARVGPAGEGERPRRPIRSPPTIAQSSSSDRSRGLERVEPGRDEPVQRGGQLVQPVAVAGLLHEGDQLLDEERVAAAALEEELDRGIVGVAAHQRADEIGGRLAVERIEVQRELVVLARRGDPALLEPGARSWRRARTAGRAGGPSIRLHRSSASSLDQCRSERIRTSGARDGEGLEERDRRTQGVVAGAGRVDAGPGHPVHQVEEALDHALGLGCIGRQLERVGDAAFDRGAQLLGVGDRVPASVPASTAVATGVSHAWRRASATATKTLASP